MGKRNRTGFFVATFLSLGLSAMACSSESAKEKAREDAGPEVSEDDAGEAAAPFEPESFVEVETSDPSDFGHCHEAPQKSQPGHDFCPGAWCSCSTDGPSLELLARASDFGEGVRFVAMQGELVLAESADKEPLLYFIDYKFNGGEPIVNVAPVPFDPPPPKTTRGRAIASVSRSRAEYAVLCDEAICTAYVLEERESGPVAKALSASIPVDEKSIVGAFLRWNEEKEPLCLYGDGIHCLGDNGNFETLLPAGGGKLLAADQRGRWLVGENGRVVRLRGNEVEEPYRGVTARLHAVDSSSDGNSAWAAGEGGVLLALGDAGPLVCRTSEYDVIGAVSYGYRLGAWIDRSGAIIRAPDPLRHRNRWCSLALMDNVLAVDFRDCGIANNFWILSAEELRGQLLCVID